MSRGVEDCCKKGVGVNEEKDKKFVPGAGITELWLLEAEPNFLRFATMRRAWSTNLMFLAARHGAKGWVLTFPFRLWRSTDTTPLLQL